MNLRDIKAAVARMKAAVDLEDLLTEDSDRRVSVSGCSGSLRAFLIAFVHERSLSDGPLVCVLPDQERAAYLAGDLRVILDQADVDVSLFPAAGVRPYDEDQRLAPEVPVARMDVLLHLADGWSGVLVTSAEALFERVPAPGRLSEDAPTVRAGDEYPPERLLQRLDELGFVVQDFVEEPGEVAVRGGIVDIFPFAGDYPVRLDYFGDEIETIREFDPSTQRSISRIGVARLVPDPQASADAEQTSLMAYLPPSTRVVRWDAVEDAAILQRLFRGATEAYEGAVEEGREVAEPEALFLNAEQFQDDLQVFSQIMMRSGARAADISFESRPVPPFNKSIGLLRETIARASEDGWDTVILADGRSQRDRLADLLGDSTEKLRYHLEVTTLHEGFELPDQRIAVYTDHQIFNRYHRPSTGSRKRLGGRLSSTQLQNMNPGDYVVHVDHGIGRYGGLEKITVRGRKQEAVKVLYQGDDLLYVNISALGRLHKYTASEGHAPKLTRLGSGQWDRVRARTKKRVKDIARDLIKLYAKRKEAKGFAFSPDSVWQQEMEATFEYEDTPDQYKASEDVKSDMEKPVPMDRLVCGDVGFGKTEVAVRAAFKAVQDGKQVAVLVPTTILAAQHAETFRGRLAEYPVRVEVLSRFETSEELKQTIAGMKSGTVDVVIGTHRLVSKDVDIPSLGLLVIDEEQRFGVRVKEKLRKFREEIDTLTLTATPIPRTLQFSLLGARDLSLITTPPPNRQPIVTEIHSWDTKLISEAIRYEVNRGGQVFFVHNRVKTIDETAVMLEALVEGVRFRIAHGQMRSRELEDVMIDFMRGRFDVLVCTNIIESGLDVTNANTIIIDRADRFGLSDLHQLRGRVGRSGRKAFCYLLVPSVHTLSRDARRRLRAIEEFRELGSGFNIAMRDLEIRGAGNLLGAEQSGFIDEIGYEAYHRILDEAVRELKNEEFEDLLDEKLGVEPVECSVDLDIDALIPADYVPQPAERLNMYRKMASATSEAELSDLSDELRDRFGDLPQVVENLIFTATVKILGSRLRLPRIQFKRERLFLSLPPQSDEAFYGQIFHDLLERLSGLPNRYVIKEGSGKTRIIVQEVPDLSTAASILDAIAAVEVAAADYVPE